MENKQAQELIERYLAGDANPEEISQVEAALNAHMTQSEVLRSDENMQQSAQRSKDIVFSTIDKPVHLLIRRRIFAAAAALLLIGFIFWQQGDWSQSNVDGPDAVAVSVDAQQILAGGNQAILTLEGGKEIMLDKDQHSIVIRADSISYGNGKSLIKDVRNSSVTYAVLTTPKGGTYQVILPDGSTVWLNAASRLRYPIRFAAHERVVELEGEAYFEITKQLANRGLQHVALAVPFKVMTKDQVVEVRGTGFNISAYADDVVTHTTLVTGSVEVIASGQGAVSLLPGQQATLQQSALKVQDVEVEQFTAWKEGYFYFDRLSPQVALAQLARWYDVDIVYTNGIPQTRIYGLIDRKKSLGSILKSLEKSGIYYKLQESEGRRKLIVTGEK